MKRVSIAVIAVMISGAAALAAPAPSRIRGTISSVSASGIVVHTADGNNLPISLTGTTKYLEVVKSNLDKVETGSYIGTATKNIGSTLVALEVVVFPPALKGIGEGHYSWDKIRDTTLSGSAATASTMTNGNVAAVAAASSAVNSTMTNGNVASASNTNGVKTLTVTYNGGQQTILVPPTAPIVTFRPATQADLTKGTKVFIQANINGGTATAGLVAVGMNGLRPPM